MTYYWKNDGFYDRPIEGGVEISATYWRELLDGQAAGKIITTDADGYPTLTDYVPSLEECIAMKLAELNEHDKGTEVNGFTLNGVTGWLDKATRMGLRSLLDVEQRNGNANILLWLSTPLQAVALSLANTGALLDALELYAKTCYDTTRTHEAAIRGLSSATEIASYDCTTGYPAQPVFNY